MMGYTDRHARYLYRLISPAVRLYTEMVTVHAILHGDRERLLAYDPLEHPLAVQLGGSEPALLARAAVICAESGFDEINLNVGCPSDRVQSGAFGACLMATPGLVADCVAAMRSVVDIPVTVKCRIGIDEQDSYAALEEFIGAVAAAGCQHFIVHARKAWLQGLSPRQNREVPPLDYARVYRLKREHPELCVTLNGGIRHLEDVSDHLAVVDGVMLGREAVRNPWILAGIDVLLGDGRVAISRNSVMQRYIGYMKRQLAAGVAPRYLVKPLFGLMADQPGARRWRRTLTGLAVGPVIGHDRLDVLLDMLDKGGVSTAGPVEDDLAAVT